MRTSVRESCPSRGIAQFIVQLAWQVSHRNVAYGRHFIIDKVICRRQAAAAKAGGQGDRYTIAVCGQERYLFFERSSNISGNTIGKWYVEVEVPVQ